MTTRVLIGNMILILLVGAISTCLLGCDEREDQSVFTQAKLAILNEQVEQLIKCLEVEPSIVNESDTWDQSSLLHIACASSLNKEIVRVLIDAASDVNSLDDLGRTPLHNAYRFSAGEEIISLLKQNGARSDTKDSHGKVPSDYLKKL